MGLPLRDSKEVIMTWVIPIQPTDLNRLWGKNTSITLLDSSQPHLGETRKLIPKATGSGITT